MNNILLLNLQPAARQFFNLKLVRIVEDFADVKTAKMHLFTLIQMSCLVVLWIVKSTKASLAFPFFLILMVPLRGQLKHFFSQRELRALDGDQPDVDVDDDEPDFYAEAPLPG